MHVTGAVRVIATLMVSSLTALGSKAVTTKLLFSVDTIGSHLLSQLTTSSSISAPPYSISSIYLSH